MNAADVERIIEAVEDELETFIPPVALRVTPNLLNTKARQFRRAFFGALHHAVCGDDRQRTPCLADPIGCLGILTA
jgi:hypothetical protein